MPVPLNLCAGPGPHSGVVRMASNPLLSSDSQMCSACADTCGYLQHTDIVWPQNDVTADNVPPELVD